MENHLAQVGLLLGLVVDSRVLRYTTPVPLEKASEPPALWKTASTNEAMREQACVWLADCMGGPQRAEKRELLRVVPPSYVPSKDNSTTEQQLLAISEDKLLLQWLVDSTGMGHLSRAQEVLNGLFGFLQAIVWPPLTGPECGRRLLVEPDLPAHARAAVQEHDRFETQRRELLRESVTHVLSSTPSARELYDLIDKGDHKALKRIKWLWKANTLGLSRKQLLDCAEKIASGAPDAIDSQSHLGYLILLNKLKQRAKASQFEWHSAAYESIDSRASVENSRLMYAATDYYAQQFRDFCLRADIRELEQSLFFRHRMAGSRPYEDLVRELADSKTPLPLERQLH